MSHKKISDLFQFFNKDRKKEIVKNIHKTHTWREGGG
jgi:hypothetical protein